MKYKVISFDMQGTLTNSAFSDEFWMEALPKLYSKVKRIPLTLVKKELKERFKDYGIYDFRYYSTDYWSKELGSKIKVDSIQKGMKNKPLFYEEMLDFIKDLSKRFKLIIISTTTKDFLDIELGKNKRYFHKLYSSLDDFKTAGKTPEVYKKVLRELNLKPKELLHIGDNIEMDIINADKAGCSTFFFDKNKSIKDNIAELGKLHFSKR